MTVTVNPPPNAPQIHSFTVSPETVTAGTALNKLTFAWKTSNAVKIDLEGAGHRWVSMKRPDGEFTPRKFTQLLQDTTFSLIAHGPPGVPSTTKKVIVQVGSPEVQLSSDRYVPHIAQGWGWTTELHVFNICSSRHKYRMFFFDANGQEKAFQLQQLSNDSSYERTTGAVAWEPGLTNHIAGEEGRHVDGEVDIWRFPDTGSELLQGYALIVDDSGGTSVNNIIDGGCVTADVVYKQHLSDGEVRTSAVPLQSLWTNGAELRFDNTSGCTTGVAIFGGGEEVRLTAVTSAGEVLGQANLGNVYHTAFPLAQELPVEGLHGTVHIYGVEVGMLGLEFCDGELVQFRLPQPVPQ